MGILIRLADSLHNEQPILCCADGLVDSLPILKLYHAITLDKETKFHKSSW